MNPNLITTLNLPKVGFAVSGSVLWGALGFVALLSVIFGVIISYHYRDFGFETIKTGLLRIIYTIVCAGLLAISALFIILYLDSLS